MSTATTPNNAKTLWMSMRGLGYEIGRITSGGTELVVLDTGGVKHDVLPAHTLMEANQKEVISDIQSKFRAVLKRASFLGLNRENINKTFEHCHDDAHQVKKETAVLPAHQDSDPRPGMWRSHRTFGYEVTRTTKDDQEYIIIDTGEGYTVARSYTLIPVTDTDIRFDIENKLATIIEHAEFLSLDTNVIREVFEKCLNSDEQEREKHKERAAAAS